MILPFADARKLILRAAREQRLAVLCGAGISFDAPSNLPVASGLIDAVLEFYTPKTRACLKTLTLRPELIMQHVANYDARGLLKLLSATLSGSQPNNNHLCLAECLRAGNNVITTNFDELIELACAMHSIDYSQISVGYACKQTQSTLLKIHGTLSNPASIVHTLNRVNRGLPPELTDALRRSVAGRVLVVIGYSGLDQLDILPALRRSGFRECIWLWHDASTATIQPLKTCPNTELKLPRTKHYRGSTRVIVDLIGKPSSGSIAKTSDREYRISVDMLMHGNKYREVHRIIKEAGLRGDLFFDVANFECTSSLSVRTPAWRRARRALLKRLTKAVEDKDYLFVASLSKWLTSESQLNKLAKVVAVRVAEQSDAGEKVYEAAVEIVYELIWRKRYSLAALHIHKLLSRLKEHGYGLLEARALNELGYLQHERFIYCQRRKSYLQKGVQAVEAAINLLAPELYNDEFFLHQALLNKANIIRWMGRVAEAWKLYDKAYDYFVGVSVNNLIFIEYERAFMSYHLGNEAESTRRLDSVLQLNKSHRRVLWNGFYFRLRALIIFASNGVDPTARVTMLKMLKRSIAAFRKEGNAKELEYSKALYYELLHMQHLAIPCKHLQPTLFQSSRRILC